MAEAVLFGLAKSVLVKLSDPALKEFLLLWNVDKDLIKLQQTTETISDVLHDAEKKEPTELAAKRRLSRLRAVLYDVDDLFDVVAYMALRKKVMPGSAFKKEVRQFFSKKNQLAFNYKIARGMRDIREALDDIEKNRKLSGSRPIINVREEPQGVPFKETHSFEDTNGVFERDNDKDDIIRLLLARGNSERNFSVVSVIGFGGLGKTTLAKVVYGDERVKRSFDLCLWVCINYFSDLKLVLVAILTSLSNDSKTKGKSLDKLQQMLRKEIEGKRFLLVLDDVWDENISNWVELEKLLNCGKSGSMVLATTRNRLVARCLDAIKPYHELNVLSKDSAHSLFVKMASEDGEFSRYSNLGPLVQQIVSKCGRVPLVLVTIGRMLRFKKKDYSTLSSFVENELAEALSGDIDRNNLLQVLKVSYDDLPSAIKHCFAYCSLFPKDYEFEKDELVRLWLAQGFVEEHSTRSLEEVGDNYFFYMVDRCFFQEVKTFTLNDDSYPRLREVKPYKRDAHAHACLMYKCKMHDLLHDLAIQVAGRESKCYDGKFSSEEIKSNAFRHIYITHILNFSSGGSCLSLLSKTIRTIIVRDGAHSKELVAFKMLRVLSLGSLSWPSFGKLPDSFKELIHLRYLDISKNGYKVLPDSICKLHYLQTLDLRYCAQLKELPSNVGRLVSLRHLFVEGCTCLNSSTLASLTSLVTLDQLSVNSSNGGLRYLSDLQKLSGMIRVELPEKGWPNCIDDAGKSNMSTKKELHGMILYKKVSHETTPVEMCKEETKAILEAFQPHVNLQYLNIRGFGSETLSSWFSSLSNLKELTLDGIKTLEYLDPNGVTSDSIFQSLRILILQSLPKLKGWWKKAATPNDDTTMAVLPRFPNVSEVVIKDCPNLMESSMPSFGRIENLKLERVNGKLVSEILNTSNLDKVEEIKGSLCLPEGSIKHWTALRSLNINMCWGLWVSYCGLACLTALEKLVIQECGNVLLKDEDDEKVKENKGQGLPWKNLSRLCHLKAPWQRYLQGGLQYLTSVEELRIQSYDSIEEATEETSHNRGLGMSWKDLQRLRHLELSWQSDFLVGLQYLTSLEKMSLKYDGNGQVKADNQGMEVRGKTWEGLAKLQTLTIDFNRKETFCFPNWIQFLLCVQDLTIVTYGDLTISWEVLASMKLLCKVHLHVMQKVINVNVHKIMVDQRNPFNSLLELHITSLSLREDWINDIPWKHFRSLRTLLLEGLKEPRSLPDGIQHLTSLQNLRIANCRGIKTIPEWMTKLTSLQRLDIRLTQELKERCKRESGADWPLVSHIPDIST